MTHNPNADYSQGDSVEFSYNGKVWWPATVCGMSHTQQPLIGAGWIIKPMYPIADHPFTHIMAFGCQLRPIRTTRCIDRQAVFRVSRPGKEEVDLDRDSFLDFVEDLLDHPYPISGSWESFKAIKEALREAGWFVHMDLSPTQEK